MIRKFALAAALIGVLTLAALPVGAQDIADTITVTGTGSVTGTPDIAEINIGVRTVNAEVSAAFALTNQTVQNVINAVTGAGVAREDVRTISIYAYVRENYPNGFPEPGVDPQRSYEVTNDLRITVRNADTVGDVIAAAVAAGANNLYGLSFRFSNQEELEQQARAEAVANARAQAEELAGLTNVQLGEVVVIREAGGGGGLEPVQFAAMGGGGGGGGGAPVEPGQLTVSAQIQMTYRIAR